MPEGPNKGTLNRDTADFRTARSKVVDPDPEVAIAYMF